MSAESRARLMQDPVVADAVKRNVAASQTFTRDQIEHLRNLWRPRTSPPRANR